MTKNELLLKIAINCASWPEDAGFAEIIAVGCNMEDIEQHYQIPYPDNIPEGMHERDVWSPWEGQLEQIQKDVTNLLKQLLVNEAAK